MNWHGKVLVRESNKEAAAATGREKQVSERGQEQWQWREADTFDIGLKGVKQNYIDKLSPDVLWGKGLENQRIN